METFTIFLLKESLQNAIDALDEDKQTTPYQLSEGFPLIGTLFVGAQNRSTPSWVQLFNPYLLVPVGQVYTASISAVLIVSYDDRFFAITFGHGKSLLKPTSWVRDFGLKATLNRVDPTKLRSIDSKIYDDLVVSTRKQTSKSSAVSSFELDVGRALMRGVTGDAEHAAFSRLTGADALKLSSELPIQQLDTLLEEVLSAYKDTAYQHAFGWVDNIREVDPIRVEELDAALIQELTGNGDETNAYLAPAEIVDWENIHGFNYTYGSKGITHLELNLRTYLHILADKGIDMTPELLRHNRVRVRYEEQEELRDRWPIYDCLVWETELDGGRFVLFDGRWFAIEQAYSARVTEYVDALVSETIVFPNAPAAQSEGAYNAATANGFPDIYALLDREPFFPTGGATQIEFCDLLSSTRQIIHVKKRSSSATLSHLFSQGSVASDLFLQDQQLRNAVSIRLTEMNKPEHALLIPPNRPTSSDYEIVYAIIAREGQHGWPPPLPFFSSVNLMHHAARVTNLGFRVSLQYIRQD